MKAVLLPELLTVAIIRGYNNYLNSLRCEWNGKYIS